MIRSIAGDVECLPDLFSIAFVDLQEYLQVMKCENEKGKAIPLTDVFSCAEIKEKLNSLQNKRIFIITPDDDTDLLPLAAYLNEMNFTHINNIPVRTDFYGFNILSYDNLMIAAFLMYFTQCNNTKELCHKLKQISDNIISHQDDKEYFWHDSDMRLIKEYRLPYVSVDIMRVFGLNRAGVNVDKETGKRTPYGKSLKQTSINIKWYDLFEYGDFDKNVKDKVRLSNYNFNDVYIVCECVRLKIDEVRLRYSITNSYGVDVLSDARSKIADKLVTKFYSEMSGLSKDKFIKLRTERTILSFDKVIFPHIQFKTPELQNLLNEMKLVKIRKTTKSEFERTITFKGTTYTIATGGIHSLDPPRILTSTNEYTYIHWDYKSYYPSIMIAYEIAPKHLNKLVFIKLVKYLRDTRVSAKDAAKHPDAEQVVPGVPNQITAEALKIVINSIYGKFGDENSFIYDRLAQLKVTINGQLMTMTLVEELELNGIHVVSANTDGIVIKLPKAKREVFKDIVARWNEINKMGADGEEYDVLIQRDINNYVDRQLNSTIEYKGDLDPNMFLKDLTKGYDAPIVAKAVCNYFLENIPIMETLTKATNILDFCKTQNVSRKWKLLYKHVVNSEIVEEAYQRNTRYYVSKHGGSLTKVNLEDGRTQQLAAGVAVTPINTLTDDPISTRDINYAYYYNECFKITNPIQLGISSKGKGKTICKKLGGVYGNLFDFEDDT